MESLRGKLLIAGPTLLDPNFARSVVLIGEHSEDGALGVILNRPSETPVSEAVPDLSDLVSDEAPVFVGGPVQPSAVLVLAEFDEPDAAPALILEDLGFLAIEDDDDRSALGLRRARVFAGYAGWGPGQLESELDRDDWIIEDGSVEDVFDEDPAALWARALERKGGQYRLVARMPLDPSLN